MKALPWRLRDLIYLTGFVAVLIGMNYGLEALPIGGMAYYNRIIVLMGVNITLAVSLNIINGHAGQFSLGHAGFMAIGAYFAAFLTVTYLSPYVTKLPPTPRSTGSRRTRCSSSPSSRAERLRRSPAI